MANVSIPCDIDHRKRFKIICANKGVTMTEELHKFIDEHPFGNKGVKNE